jgi:hypothetical protein
VSGSDIIFLWMAILASALVALGMIIGARVLADTRKAKAEVTSSETYRKLADEYRRLAEMSITAQEHTDLKLADINLRLEQLRDQLDFVQRILKDVE